MDAEILVQEYTPLVYREAHRAFRRVPRSAGLTVEDLAQEGWAEVLYAATKWDPRRLTAVQSERAVFMAFLTMTLRHRYGRLAKQGWAREGVWGLDEAEEGISPRVHSSKGLLEAIVDAERAQDRRARMQFKKPLSARTQARRAQTREVLAEARRVASLPDRYSSPV